MRRSILLALFIAAIPAAAAVPDKDHVAIGGALGFFVPFEGDYNVGFAVEGSADYYLTQRLGLRATFGYLRSGSDFAGNPKNSVGSFLISGVYNWEMGRLHPFGAAGLGVHRVDPPFGGAVTRVGVHFGGGVDWFFTRRATVFGEGRAHLMKSAHDLTTSYLTLTGGVRYFF